MTVSPCVWAATGPYLEDAEGKRANVPADLAPDELSVAKAHELFAVAAEDGRELGC